MALNEAYRAAHESAVLVDHDRRGLLKLTGANRLELIDRMSTQAVKSLRPGEGAATVLTTDIGRIIDRIIVYAADDHALILTGEGHADALARYFMRNIFFNDDVQLRDTSAETAIYGIYGPRAVELLTGAGIEAAGLPLHHWRPATAGGVAATIYRADPVAGDGFVLMAGATDHDRIEVALSAAGIAPVDDAAYDYLRIEAGRPRFGHELTLDYIPLEAGLWDDVSFSKGCYVGQEIIARMESRGKLAKRLVRLRTDASLAAGTEVTSAGRPVGTITSAANGPAGPLALGYVKSVTLDTGAELTAGGVSLAVIHTGSQ
jgi:aminomethyltransferase